MQRNIEEQNNFFEAKDITSGNQGNDPFISAAHSKVFGFCGSVGVDLMEPLSFKGRRGSGIAGDRLCFTKCIIQKWEK
jgi:hypothetical protein